MKYTHLTQSCAALLCALTLLACDDEGGAEPVVDVALITDAAPDMDLTPDEGLMDMGLELDVGLGLDMGLELDMTPALDEGVRLDQALPPFLPPDAGQTATGGFKARAGVHYVALWGAPVEAAVTLFDVGGEVVAQGVTDSYGSLVLREIAPGAGYAVALDDDPSERVDDLEVLDAAGSLPDEAFYAAQRLEPGFGYLTTRDGTRLSVFVSLPGPPEEGPYPTVVNYSGYSPSQPGEPMGGPASALCGLFPILCDAPSFPSGIIAGVMGYAAVGVNVRGTGCSGGAYDYFDTPQILDGYDVIEIVARQPWVKHHKVGMVGLSFPGITQLFVAATRPPSLAAIAPMSVIADTASSTLVPGGIYNNGFAMEWITNVLNKASPYAHQWIHDVVDGGDTLCEEHQLLHDQKVNAVQKSLEYPFYTDEVALPIDPSQFVDQIEVPVFLVGQWQDEQTGPHFAALADKFVNAPLFRMTATNGVHMDGFAPQVLGEWSNFLALYVAREAPSLSGILRNIVPVFMQEVFGAPLSLPPDRLDPEDYEAAKAAYEAEPSIQIIYESGVPEEVEPGAPQGTFSARFDAWPIPETAPYRLYLQPGGQLALTPPEADGGASAFEHEPEAGARSLLASGSVNGLQPRWAYRQPTPGKAASFISAPLETDMVFSGHGSVDLWIKSTATDADIEVNLSEVRPDGFESYVQAGWLRASHRALRQDATELRPVKSHYERDAAPLVIGEWTLIRVEVMPFGHIFRAGSQLRLIIDTPGDSMASWHFMLLEHDAPPTHTIGHDAAHPSSVALPLIPTVEVPTPLPDCARLRGQPCRPYLPYENTPIEAP